jgi:hypothetical protein
MRNRTLLVLVAGLAGACRSEPNVVTIDALSQSSLNASTKHTPAGASLSVLLDFSAVGEPLGDDCPVVRASAALNGAPLIQIEEGGPTPCDDPGSCDSHSPCRAAAWTGSFPAGFPPSADGLVTLTLRDAGAPATMVGPLDLWADAALSEASPPTGPDTTRQAILTLTAQGPYATSTFALTNATDSPGPFISLHWRSDEGEALFSLAETGTPNAFQVSLPSKGELVPVLSHGFDGEPTLSSCWGVGACLASTSAELAPLAVSLP